jgi:hypothetical protein
VLLSDSPRGKDNVLVLLGEGLLLRPIEDDSSWVGDTDNETPLLC